jgi:hypothetical protein
MIGTLITLIVYLLVIGILLWLVWYIIDAIPIPDPPARFIKLAVIVICVLVAVVILLDFAGISTGWNVPRLNS